ncbi:type II toxin-antitoxin system RelE/ParE family toxin [Reyranella sp.]|uniref:type II toxin-antitoxin system RelE/ParE family toxin n=1 Tax=Reyranella sp. TaxID=1929291 RepID=UPI0037831C58
MIRRTVTFTPQAHSDLLNIGDWITERAGADVARSYIARLENYCLGFEFAGERGQRRDDLRPGLRVIGFERRVAIAFAISEDEVVILRLHYGGQNWDLAN